MSFESLVLAEERLSWQEAFIPAGGEFLPEVRGETRPANGDPTEALLNEVNRGSTKVLARPFFGELK